MAVDDEAAASRRPRTLRLARVADVDVFVHYSWLGIAALIVLGLWGTMNAEYPELADPAAGALATVGAALFFGSVLLHELAHAVMARRRNIEVKGITLYLFGGATEADASSRSAADEFTIAIVGPATSLVLAATFGIASVVVGSSDQPVPGLLGYLAAVNLILAVFNMAPGLPLDGGRVFRSAVWAVSGDFDKATRWATAGGVGIGYLLVGVGLVGLWSGQPGGLWLVALGWIISQSARQNESQERLRTTFEGLVAADVMTTPVVSIPSHTRLADAVGDYFARRDETAFPVVDGETVVGLLTVGAVRRLPVDALQTTTAGEAALPHPSAMIVERDTPMIDVLTALSGQTRNKARVLVLDNGTLIGIISPADVLRRQSLTDLIEQA